MPSSPTSAPGPRVYHRQYGPLLADAVDATDLVLIDVDDGSGVEPLPGSTGYEAAVATPVVRPAGPVA